jgi:hypothetical protein
VVAVVAVVQKLVLAVLHQVAAVLVLVTLLLLPGRQTLVVVVAVQALNHLELRRLAALA